MPYAIKTSSRLSAILLAAGRGTRSRTFKPLIPFNSQTTFLSTVYQSLRSSRQFQEILVVTGFQKQLLDEPLNDLAAKSIFNSNYLLGMHRSIQVGLTHLTLPWTGTLIAHVDQPHLTAEDYKSIAMKFQMSDKNLIRPSYQGKLGNPAIIGQKYLKEILQEPDRDSGCAYLFKRYPEDVALVEMPNDRCCIDYDFGLPTSHE